MHTPTAALLVREGRASAHGIDEKLRHVSFMVTGDGGTQLGMEPEKETSGRWGLVLLFFTLVLSVFSGSDGHKIELGC